MQDNKTDNNFENNRFENRLISDFGEFRKDYLLDRWVALIPSRAKRPHVLANIEHNINVKCPFCPGQITEKTKYEILDQNNNWKVKAINNKFPVVKDNIDFLQENNRFFNKVSAYGYHEVVIETPNHNLETEDLSIEDIKDIFLVYINRIKELSDMPFIRYVSVFKNRGAEAGASLKHSHSQIVATSIVPSAIKEEHLAYFNYYIENERCAFCDIIQVELNSERKIFENEEFIAIAPFASRFALEAWILPKEHLSSITDLSEFQLLRLSEIYKKIIKRLSSLGRIPYNMYIHNSEVNDKHFHFHIEITPRILKWAGLELSTNIIVNPISPEKAAKFYKGEYDFPEDVH